MAHRIFIPAIALAATAMAFSVPASAQLDFRLQRRPHASSFSRFVGLGRSGDVSVHGLDLQKARREIQAEGTGRDTGTIGSNKS